MPIPVIDLFAGPGGLGEGFGEKIRVAPSACDQQQGAHDRQSAERKSQQNQSCVRERRVRRRVQERAR